MPIPAKGELSQRPAPVAYAWAAAAGGLRLIRYATYGAGGLLVLAVLAANLAWWISAVMLAISIWLYHEIEHMAAPSERTVMWTAGAVVLAGVLGAFGGSCWAWMGGDQRYGTVVVDSMGISLTVGLLEAALGACWWTVSRVGGWLKARAGRGAQEAKGLEAPGAPATQVVVPFVRPGRKS